VGIFPYLERWFPLSWTSKRARLASLRRFHPDDDPIIVEARREFRAEWLADLVRRSINEAPPLTHSERARIARILRGGDDAAA
jgi:hypothetical protein